MQYNLNETQLKGTTWLMRIRILFVGETEWGRRVRSRISVASSSSELYLYCDMSVFCDQDWKVAGNGIILGSRFEI